MTDRVEFYNQGDGLPIAAVDSSIVPPVGHKISIRGEVWNVQRITYALDYADKPPSERVMRANIDLLRVAP